MALSANYPFATVEPNVGVVAVPENRLKVLSELVQREESIETEAFLIIQRIAQI